MTGMTRYYLSRALISVALGSLFAVAGARWWGAALISIGLFGFFVWAPRSGLYIVRPERGVDPLQGDERAQLIGGKAAYTALLVTWLALGALINYFHFFAPSDDVSIHFLDVTVFVSMGTFIATWFWLRRV